MKSELMTVKPFVEGVGGREVVVLAGVDDDAGARVEHAGQVLVDERALHVDVAEDDAVHGVVEHHVQALERAHGGDLRHAEAAGVVAQPDIAAQLLAHLVEAGAHEAEVLLRGVGAAEALGGQAVRHVVEQALRRGADDGDHVGAGAGGRLGLHDVLVDVAGGDDDVDPRFDRVAELADQLLAPCGGRRRPGRRPPWPARRRASRRRRAARRARHAAPARRRRCLRPPAGRRCPTAS